MKQQSVGGARSKWSRLVEEGKSREGKPEQDLWWAVAEQEGRCLVGGGKTTVTSASGVGNGKILQAGVGWFVNWGLIVRGFWAAAAPRGGERVNAPV